MIVIDIIDDCCLRHDDFWNMRPLLYLKLCAVVHPPRSCSKYDEKTAHVIKSISLWYEMILFMTPLLISHGELEISNDKHLMRPIVAEQYLDPETLPKRLSCNLGFQTSLLFNSSHVLVLYLE